MAPDLLLGIDVGNTVVKAVLFDMSGRRVATHGVDGVSLKPSAGMVERPIADLWASACQAISGCLAKTGEEGHRIAAIGLAGHGNGLYLLDREGEPLIGIQSLDSRAAGQARDLDQRVGKRLHEICLQRPWPAQTPVLLGWLKSHRPDLYVRAGTLSFAKDILCGRLTGTRVAEVSDMSGAGLLRLPDAAYDEELLGLYGLEDAMSLLPTLVLPTDVVGQVTPEAAAATGLAAGTPVVAGYFDVIASALGSGAAGPGNASIVLGSWSINQVFTRTPIRDPRVFMVSAFGDERYSSMENSATSAANLEWYVRTLVERGAHHPDPFGHVNEAVATAPIASDDPMFHPFLYGSRHGAHHRGGFYGLAGWHDEGHLLRAVFEGVCFEHRRHIGVLRAAGADIDEIVLSGGGARSPVWCQMMADCLAQPIILGSEEESGALGAAIAAAIGIGRFPDEIAGAAAMTHARARLAPDPAASAVADRRFAVWSRLTAAMEPYWDDLADPGDA